MPVLRLIRERFAREQPLKGLRMSACLHVTTETANLAITLKAGGADLVLCASNPLSTQDDVAASLMVDDGIPTFAIKGEDEQTYYRHICAGPRARPQMTMDDGCDLVSTLHKEREDLIPECHRRHRRDDDRRHSPAQHGSNSVLRFPVLAVNESDTKHLFDNRYGTGQSTVDAIIRATNVLLAGRTFVVLGYGWCGRGVASRAHGMGANVIVTEVNPVARHRGGDGRLSRDADARELRQVGDIFVTVTGNLSRHRRAASRAHEGRRDDLLIPATSMTRSTSPRWRSWPRRHREVRDFVERIYLAPTADGLPAGRWAPGEPLRG